MKRPQQALETEQLFLVVRWSAGDVVNFDYWPCGEPMSARQRLPGDGTLVIERGDRREPAAVYSASTPWRVTWEMRRPSEIEYRRADRHAPR